MKNSTVVNSASEQREKRKNWFPLENDVPISPSSKLSGTNAVKT